VVKFHQLAQGVLQHGGLFGRRGGRVFGQFLKLSGYGFGALDLAATQPLDQVLHRTPSDLLSAEALAHQLQRGLLKGHKPLLVGLRNPGNNRSA